jgi:hypothetical protein
MMFLYRNSDLGFFKALKESLSTREAAMSLKEKDFSLMLLMDFRMSWTGFALLSVPRIATACLDGLFQLPPKTVPWWRSCKWVSEGSKIRKATPSFLAILQKT